MLNSSLKYLSLHAIALLIYQKRQLSRNHGNGDAPAVFTAVACRRNRRVDRRWVNVPRS